MLTDPVIARLFVDKIREEPDYFMPKKIQQMIKEQWKLVATRNQCQEARNKALKWIAKESEDQFAHIRGYCKEIIESNQNSTVVLETTPGAVGEEDLFDRFYVCFDVIKNSWKKTCRLLIGIDGTFLKNTLKGQLLVAMGRDGNNQMYPIAWAIVQVENEYNWMWFIQMLKKDLDLRDGDGYVITSDRQKGLIIAVQTELPLVEHRKCVRHIYGNLKANHGKKMEMKKYIWRLAWSYNDMNFQKNLRKLRAYDEVVYNDIMRSNPKTWCRAFYKNDGRCVEDVDNNTVESFNGSIVKARERPALPMLEKIRRLAMSRIAERKQIVKDHKEKFTPYVKKLLDEEHEAAMKCTIWPGTHEKYEVVIGGQSERVDIKERKCTCWKWDIRGIPCEHAYGVIIECRFHSDDFVADWFLTTRWRATYDAAPNPLRGSDYWASGDIALVKRPPEPRQPGRKKKVKKQKRKESRNESPKKPKYQKKPPSESDVQTDQPRRIMHCKNCGQAGHNSRSCAKRAKRGQGEASGNEIVLHESQLTQV